MHIFNTKENKLIIPVDGTPLNPSPDFVYGFKGCNEVVEKVVEDDRRLLEELGITHEQCACFVERIFETTEDEFCGCPIVRWKNIHSPICPWDDFCTKSFFDTTLAVTEIWLCNPAHILELSEWAKRVHTNSYPIADLKRFVDSGRIMVFSDLHPHLIRSHHFFEGHETPYRVDPRKLFSIM